MRYSPDISDTLNNSNRLKNVNLAISKGTITSDYVTEESSLVSRTLSGDTTTPTAPTLTAQGVYKAIVLKWTEQTNLSNLDYYELQVSSDNATWYSLKTDGTDWKDTLGSTTIVYGNRFVHYFPFGGTEDDPDGVQLYYKVRATTKAAVSSAFSSSATATSSTIDTGDIAVNSITANKLTTTILDTLFANIGYEAIIGFKSASGSTTYDSPGFGDTRLYLDGDEISYDIYVYDDTGTLGWVSSMRIGGQNADEVATAMIKARGLYNDDSLLFDDELIPDREYLHYTFDNTKNEARGQTGDWTSIKGGGGTGTESYVTDTWNAKLTKVIKFQTGAVTNDNAIIQSTKYQSTFATNGYSLAVYVNNDSIVGEVGFLGINATDGIIGFNIYDDKCIFYSYDGTNTVTKTINIASVGWHIIYIGYNSDTKTIYYNVDGADTEEHTITSWAASLSAALTLGSSGTANCSVLFSDLIFCNKYFTINEIQEHYSSGAIWNSKRAKTDLLLLSTGTTSVGHNYISEFQIEEDTFPKIKIKGLLGIFNSNYYSFPSEYNITISSTSASTFYALWLNDDGVKMTTCGWTGISGNQLNVYDALYDKAKGYCYDSTNGRLIAILKTNASNTAYEYIVQIYNLPHSYIQAVVGTAQTIATSTTTNIEYDTINIDLNSEYNTTTWRYEAKITQKISCNASVESISVYNSYFRRLSVGVYDAGAVIRFGSGFDAVNAIEYATTGTTQGQSAGIVTVVNVGSRIIPAYRQQSGGNININANTISRLTITGWK